MAGPVIGEGLGNKEDKNGITTFSKFIAPAYDLQQN
jgi:hypothetical protein